MTMKMHENTSTTVYKKSQVIFYENDGQPQNLSIKPVISLSILMNILLMTKSKVKWFWYIENELLETKPVTPTFNVNQ